MSQERQTWLGLLARANCPVFGIREPDQDMPISYPLNKGKYNE